mmetsp:Transcript_12659/g.22645  ORF Transcript_12659/g.22645 Transcript_12659/m.22645 type:complete len:280 (-) Transcript_12659:271-1110(-)
MHTAGGGDTRPWWAVDLQSAHKVHRVRIINRQDCCTDRLRNFKISVSNQMPSPALGQEITGTNAVCKHVTGVPNQDVILITCDSPVVGRYLSLQILETQLLGICEVEVYGEPGGAWPSPPFPIYLTSCARGTPLAAFPAFGGMITVHVPNLPNALSSTPSLPRRVEHVHPCLCRFLKSSCSVMRRCDVSWKLNFLFLRCTYDSYRKNCFVSPAYQIHKDSACVMTLTHLSFPRAATPPPPSSSLSNVALGKPTEQSTVGWGGVSSRAVDGSQSGVGRHC